MAPIAVDPDDGEKSPYGKYKEYEVKDALRTLTQAMEIKEDKELMRYVKECAAKESQNLKEVASIADLKERAKSKEAEENKEGEP